MKCEYYQRKLNDVIQKCPIEAGIEILVYNLLDSVVNDDEYSLVDINRIWKRKDNRLNTEGGISDIAILSTDFIFAKEDIGMVYGFVEVKAAGVALEKSDVQVSKQKKNVAHLIHTNGILWRYYFNGKILREINISESEVPYSFKTVKINKDRFEELKQNLKEIDWKLKKHNKCRK